MHKPNRLFLRVMFKNLLLLSMLLLPQLLMGQKKGQAQIDSILTRLPKLRQDTNRVNAYDKLSTAYMTLVKDIRTDKAALDQVQAYATRELELAQLLKWNKGIVNAYMALAGYYSNINYHKAALEQLQKGYDIADGAAAKNKVLRVIGITYFIAGNFDKSIETNLAVLNYYKAKPVQPALSQVYAIIGVTYMLKGDNKTYLDYELRGLQGYKENDTSSDHIKMLNSVVAAYQFQQDLPHALSFLLQEKLLVAKHGNKADLLKLNNSIGDLYNELGDYNQAIIIFKQGLKLLDGLNDPSTDKIKAGSLGGLAYSYQLKKDYSTALSYNEQTLALSGDEKTGVLGVMATNYYYQKKYALALETLNASIKNREELNRAGKIKTLLMGGQAYVPILLGEIYLNAPDSVLTKAGIKTTERYAKAREIFLKNLEYSKHILKGQLQAYKDLQALYDQMKDSVQAYKTYMAYVTINDSVNKMNNRNEFVRKDMEFGYSQKEDSLRYRQLLASNVLNNKLKLSNQQSAIEQLNVQKTQISLQAEQNKRKANEQQLKASQKEQALANATVELQRTEINNKRNQSYLFMAGIAVLVLLSFFIATNYVNQRKANRQISSANKQLQEQQEEITAQRDKLFETVTELKATQNQLIQAEKMASLGELTAGIAHEIQNPLNFVNNFSDVNREMIDELKDELKAGNMEEALALANDIGQNEVKINHHGKRADFIVKGMLQHSRTSTGERQLTNINILADEFFKLSYHGLRAKNKSFNADMMTNFDESVPRINVIQQDIGRVLLNLFNNAFYAVNQKQKTAGPTYKPMVTVSTMTENNQVVITVKDNGTGIPDAIREKIMQPFFTTKPTGEGTGLGLSLSYDILVKGHGGQLTVNSVEGEYTEFKVMIPV